MNEYLDIYEWREKCSVLNVENKHLKEKIADLTKERDEWKSRAIDLENGILKYLGT